MIEKLTKKIGTVPTILAAAVVVYLAIELLLPVWERKEAADVRIEKATESLNKARQTHDLAKRAQRNWRELENGTLKSDQSSAVSQIFNQVNTWAQSSGLTISSLRPERTEDENGFKKVTIRATGNGGMRQIGQFLYAVEKATIPVRVVDLQLSSRKDGTDDLAIQIALTTVYLPGAPGTATGGAPINAAEAIR
jgi:Tfp pilus assembly protein PilO